MRKVFERPRSLRDVRLHYCPGCGHSTLHRIVAECVDRLDIRERTIAIAPVGCAVYAYDYFDFDVLEVPHGRPPAAATGIKRSLPDRLVISYQGDGDLAAIGTAEIIHAANRGEKFTTIFVNNAIYGMTGGQMAPTTLVGERSTTTPSGRDPAVHGYPIRVCELLATLEAPVHIERVGLGSNKQIMAAARAVRRAIDNQVRGLGFSLVEVLSPCPTIWGLDPVEAQTFVRDTMPRTFPLGILRDRTATAVPRPPLPSPPDPAELPGILGLYGATAGTTGGRAGGPRHAGADHRIVAAGFGGQGVQVLGEVLAEAGLSAGYHVAWLPSYGPQMRSGTSNCHVRLCGGAVDSPLVSRPTALVALNQPSLRAFLPRMEPGTLVLFNADAVPPDGLPRGLRIGAVPATAIADRLGSPRAANMVMLGALLEATGMLAPGVVEATLQRMVTDPAWRDLDLAALRAGQRAARRALPATCLHRTAILGAPGPPGPGPRPS